MVESNMTAVNCFDCSMFNYLLDTLKLKVSSDFVLLQCNNYLCLHINHDNNQIEKGKSLKNVIHSPDINISCELLNSLVIIVIG